MWIRLKIISRIWSEYFTPASSRTDKNHDDFYETFGDELSKVRVRLKGWSEAKYKADAEHHSE